MKTEELEDLLLKWKKGLLILKKEIPNSNLIPKYEKIILKIKTDIENHGKQQ